MLTRLCEKCGVRLRVKDDSVLCEDCKSGKEPPAFPAGTSSEMPFVPIAAPEEPKKKKSKK